MNRDKKISTKAPAKCHYEKLSIHPLGYEIKHLIDGAQIALYNFTPTAKTNLINCLIYSSLCKKFLNVASGLAARKQQADKSSPSLNTYLKTPFNLSPLNFARTAFSPAVYTSWINKLYSRHASEGILDTFDWNYLEGRKKRTPFCTRDVQTEFLARLTDMKSWRRLSGINLI